jgi:hypothetical protein
MFIVIFTFTSFSAKIAGFHFECHKNSFVLVDRIMELLYFNDTAFFVWHPGFATIFQSGHG